MNQIDEMIRESILDDDDALLKAAEQAEHTFSEQFYEGLEALQRRGPARRRRRFLPGRVLAAELFEWVQFSKSKNSGRKAPPKR